MAETISAPNEAKPRARRRWLIYSLQALWVISAAYIVQLLVLSIRPGYAHLMKVCSEPVCPDGQLTLQGVASLEVLGISLQAYAIIQLIFFFAIAIIYAVVALLIFQARHDDPFTLFVSLVLLLYGVFVTTYVEVLRTVQPALSDLVDILPGITLIAFLILCYVFPDGRFLPRWTRWAAAAWIAAPFVLIVAEIFGYYDVVFGPLGLAVLGLLITCLVAPIYRYRKLSSRSQRQQLKWVLFGLTQLLLMMLVLVELLPNVFPILNVAGSFPSIASNLVQSISLMIFPITVGIALLRYRLWNVDLVLNRTLVYVPLTSILTVIYTTSMAFSQRLFSSATGEQSQAVAIFTTIVLTTTFSPIRNALQSYVDKNFKDAPGNLKELKELDKQLAQVVHALDYKAVAQRVVETVLQAHNAQGAALYLREDERMVLAYATPNWEWADGEVSILLSEYKAKDNDKNGIENGAKNTSEGNDVYGRLLLGQRSDRDDYTLDEVEDIRTATLPIVRNMVRLMRLQDDD